MDKLFDVLLSESGLRAYDLRKIITTAPVRYKTYFIPKRSGGKREIAQPAKELKILQRIIVRKYLSSLPIHACATAYSPGDSILKNAQKHAGSSSILKMDFENFFPTIRSTDWEVYCREHKVFSNEDDIIASSYILFRKAKGDRLLKLSIGAPSSPIVSNLLMLKFDEIVSKRAAELNITYTRYADDLTFSGQRIGFLKEMPELISKAIKEVPYPHLSVNKEKTNFITAAYRRQVTGLILANDGTVGLGRDRKRLISSQVHKVVTGTHDELLIPHLSGMLSYALSIEPEFIIYLKEKYGASKIDSIFSLQNKDD